MKPKIKKAESILIINGERQIKETTYYEVPISQVDEMFKKVEKGEDEEELRKKLLEE